MMMDEKLGPLRLLEDIRYWKQREREYAAMIRELTPALDMEFANLLRSWEPVFGRTEYAAAQWMGVLLRSPDTDDAYVRTAVNSLVQQAVEETSTFAGQLSALQAQSSAIRANPAADVLIRHLIGQEAPYGSGPAHTDSGAAAAGFSSGWREEDAGEGTDAGTTADVRPEAPGAAAGSPVPPGGHKLPPLPYAYNALEPYIDEETMRLHHDKHHQSYVDGLNNAEKKLAEARRSGDFSLVKHWERELAFHGAGHYLHTLFWNIMAPKAGGPPTGLAAEQIRADFGSFDAFKKQFSEAADKVEGGGWAIWVWSPRSHRTEILTAEKHQNLSQWDVVPLLALDVWEHAYYLKHKNKRTDYITDWWNVVNWKHVNERLAAARKLVWQPF